MQLQPHDANALVAFQAYGLMQHQILLTQKEQALQELAQQLDKARKDLAAAEARATAAEAQLRGLPNAAAPEETA